MVTAGTGVYLLEQLAALIFGNAPHEYAGRPALVEFAVDEDKSFRSAGDAPGFCLVPSGLASSRVVVRPSGS
jgi:hypothetical protein